MIAIPRGLPAQILTAMTGRDWMSTGQIVDAIDEANRIGEDDPGVGFVAVAMWLIERRDKAEGIKWRRNEGGVRSEWRIQSHDTRGCGMPRPFTRGS